MRGLGVRYAHANILVGPHGEAAALFRLGMVSYPFLSVSGKRELAGRLERLAQTLAADFSLYRVNRAYPAGEYLRHTAGLLDERHQSREVWESFLEAHHRRLKSLGSHVPETYLAVSLEQCAAPVFGDSLIRASDRVRCHVSDLLGRVGRAPIRAGRLEELRAAEQNVYERLKGLLRLRRARTIELQWLLARAGMRGIAEPVLQAQWEPQAALALNQGEGEVSYEPLESVLWRCANCAISEHERTLTVDGEHGRSHQAMLALGALADAPQFPGPAAELFFAPLESVGFPVDAVLHARWHANRQALAQVRKRIADVENAYREQIKGAAYGPGLQAEEDRALAREYEALLQSGAHPAMLTGWASLALGARTPEELSRRVAVLRECYGDVQLYQPAGLQHQLFFDHLPRADGGRTTDYAQQLTVEQFGAMVAVGTRLVGSPCGAYIGYTPDGSPRPVRFDPTQAPRENYPSAVLCVGKLGSGKSIAAQAVAFAAERRGSLVIDLDPKPDHGWENLPELGGTLQVMGLSSETSQQGRLDPLQIGAADMREELACSYLLELLRDPPAAWENAISQAVKATTLDPDPRLMSVVRWLCESEQQPAKDAGQALEVISDFGLARLGFAHTSKDRGPAIQTGTSLITIRIPGLSLPAVGASRESYTRSERVSVATLTLVAAYILRLISEDRSRHKIVLLDEIWFLRASPQGRQIIDRLVRLGRALNVTVLLCTQSPGDLGDLQELVGVRLAFGQGDRQAARSALELIDLDPQDKGLLRLLCELPNGCCLMRDLDGRVCQVQIDLVDPRLLAALSTTPGQPHDMPVSA